MRRRPCRDDLFVALLLPTRRDESTRLLNARAKGSSLRGVPCRRAVPRFPSAVASLRVTQFGHGQSNPTYKIECLLGSDPDERAEVNANARADVVHATYVLRKKPPGKILASAHAVEREYAVQRALGASRAVPVPEMIALCEDARVLGTPFYLMSFVPGRGLVTP